MIPCIIPARGGSKGIPRKNLLPIGGKPLIAWSIEQALASRLVDAVVVATEDEEIANVATGYGARVFARSMESATDEAPTEMVLGEVVRENWQAAEMVVFLQATSPVRPPYDIESAIEWFRVWQADSLFSARRVEGYTWDASRRFSPVPRDGPRQRRQDERRNTLEENGSIYIFRPWVLLETGSRLGGKIVPYIQHPLDSFQLDVPDDIPLIENLLELRMGVPA